MFSMTYEGFILVPLEKLNSLLAKHNLGSHTESAPGRLYQAESMCSVMSMDWEYDDGMFIPYLLGMVFLYQV